MDLRQRLRADLRPDGRCRHGGNFTYLHLAVDPSSKTLSNGKPVTKALFRQMLAEEMRVIQDELGEHRFSSGRFNDAARLMEQITTSDDLIDFLTLPGYRFSA